jgi:hypothetical protein
MLFIRVFLFENDLSQIGYIIRWHYYRFIQFTSKHSFQYKSFYVIGNRLPTEPNDTVDIKTSNMVPVIYGF